jgi:hypothetical protein
VVLELVLVVELVTTVSDMSRVTGGQENDPDVAWLPMLLMWPFSYLSPGSREQTNYYVRII